jgi:polyphosphate:AMP phosphotransferase
VFDAAELGQAVSGADFKERETALRARLLELQYRALEFAQFPVLIDFAGVDGAGKGTTVNMLNKWMDPRFLRTVGYQPPTGEERARPRFWRYWRDLPPKGRTGLFLSGRYSQPLLMHVYGELDDQDFDDRLAEIIRFESALADDGVLILKFWMHLSRDHQKARLEALGEDPLQSYKVSESDWRNHERYDDFIKTAEKIITRTNRAGAPWTIVEGVDPNYRHLRVGELIVAELGRHLDTIGQRPPRPEPKPIPAPPPGTVMPATVFDTLDLAKTAKKGEYRKKRPKLQARLGELGRKAFEQELSTVLVFEGPDASGKGGAIRRTVWSLDARTYRVHQFAAPTEEERAHHYLWRFWRRLPRAGHVAVFDRSWYGRVLVERAEGFASEAEWRRAYNEINDFEQQIVGRGFLLLKFWMCVSKDEQLRRFNERAESAYKHWKLTDEDWRNREQWDTYLQLGHDVVQFTSTSTAPWVLVEGDNKHFARLKILKTVIEHLERRLDGDGERSQAFPAAD